MINYDAFLSRAAEQMQESAIRRMGSILAQGRDIISFAPGYPAPRDFPVDRLPGDRARAAVGKRR